MTLKQWLRKNRFRAGDLAEALQCQRVEVYRWMAHKHTPNKVFLKKIYLVTDGQVTPNDFFEMGPVFKDDETVSAKTPNGRRTYRIIDG